MMIPCAFGDLGKRAKDLLEKNFPLDHVKLNLQASTRHDIDFTVTGTHSLSNRHAGLAGVLETKYKFPQHGVTLTEKWSSASVLTCDLSVEDKLAKGLKTSLESTYEAPSGKLSAALITAYKRPNINLKVDASQLTSKPLITSSLVFGLDRFSGFLAGGQATFNSLANAITSWQLAGSYAVGDLMVYSSVRNMSEYTASVHQTVNKRVETAFSVTYSQLAHASTFALVGKFNFDSQSWVKAKVDNSSLVTVAYGFTLADGVQAILGGQVDGKNLGGGKHHVGLALEFEA
jgi:hypothetical protein